MALRPPLSPEEKQKIADEIKVATPNWGDAKDRRIFYCGLTQAAVNSMALGQFAQDLATHLANVKQAVDELAAFVLDRAK